MTPPLEMHFLNAAGALRPVMSLFQTRIRAAHEEAARHLPLGPIDVVVQAGGGVIPEKGHMGYSPNGSTIFVTVDPDDPQVIADEDRSIERMLAHEFHHCSRWIGPGYGTALGAILVTEGLACRFARDLYGPPPEPWEVALGSWETRPHRELALAEWTTSADFGRWFLGAADLPRWVGYTLGSQIVDAYLERHPEETAASLVHAPAGTFRPQE